MVKPNNLVAGGPSLVPLVASEIIKNPIVRRGLATGFRKCGPVVGALIAVFSNSQVADDVRKLVAPKIEEGVIETINSPKKVTMTFRILSYPFIAVGAVLGSVVKGIQNPSGKTFPSGKAKAPTDPNNLSIA